MISFLDLKAPHVELRDEITTANTVPQIIPVVCNGIPQRCQCTHTGYHYPFQFNRFSCTHNIIIKRKKAKFEWNGETVDSFCPFRFEF